MEILIILSSFVIAGLGTLLIKRRSLIELVSVVASLVAFAGSFVVALRVASTGTYAPYYFFSVDSLGAIMMMIIGSIGLCATVYSVKYLRRETEKEIIGFTRVKQFYTLLNFFLVAMFFAVMSNSPVFAWISIEATTLSTAFLISFYNKPGSIEAAWKYLIINTIGLLLAFFGTLLYFTSFGESVGGVFVSWDLLTKSAIHLNPVIAKIAFVFALIGYGTKVGLAPMHTWLPDAHSKAPAPISALLSGVLLNVAFVTMIRFKAITDIAAGPSFSQGLLITFGFLSILVAAFINFDQKNYKRLLAYSSIENMGITALGFGIGGLGILAGTLHLIYHAFIKSALFLSAGTIFLKYSSTKIDNIRGTHVALPFTGIFFLLGFFIVTGTPPFGMFNTKVLIFTAGIAAHPIATIASLFAAALLFVAFFNHATKMFFGKKPEDVELGEESIWLIIPPLVLITVVVILSFYIPPFLKTLISDIITHY